MDTYFGVFADVAGLGEGGAVGHAEGDGEDAGERFGHEGLADAGRTEEEDVGFLEGEGGWVEDGRGTEIGRGRVEGNRLLLAWIFVYIQMLVSWAV